jgi:multidrug resistance efflux pump
MSASEFARPFSFRQGWLKAVEARIDGQVVEVPAGKHELVDRVLIAEGQLVKKGELLVELDHRELDRRVEAAATELDRAVVESMAANGSAGLQPLRMLSRVDAG